MGETFSPPKPLFRNPRRGLEKGSAFTPPMMVNLFDSQTRLAIAQTPKGDRLRTHLTASSESITARASLPDQSVPPASLARSAPRRS